MAYRISQRQMTFLTKEAKEERFNAIRNSTTTRINEQIISSFGQCWKNTFVIP